jgi:ABC-type phosphate/phosphonate transport system substrate-binding protein
MLASLPMYDFPEIATETDAFWAALAEELGVSIPLTRGTDWTRPWRSQALLFSQTCGYPFTHEFKGKLTYVATPHYEADGCVGPNYCSIIFARERRPLQAFKGQSAAFNARDSMSGMLALKSVFVGFAESGVFFNDAIETGSHLASLEAVQSGQANVCAIDCVTVELCRRYRPQALSGLVEVTRSAPVPGLPFVTTSTAVSKLRTSLRHVLAHEALQKTRNTLLLSGMSVLEPQAYTAIELLELQIQDRGGLKLW